jgi:hypothetical protein
MRVKIQNLRLRALCEKSLFLRSLEKGEVVEPGTDIYVKVPNEAHTKMATLVSLGETEDHVLFDDKKIPSFHRVSLYSTEPTKDVMINDILAMVVKRGFRNIAHVDPQKIIECYAKDFAERYKPILDQIREEWRR